MLTRAINRDLITQRVLDDPDFADRLTAHELCGLSPLLWSSVALHSTFALDLGKRIDYNCGAAGATVTEVVPG